MQKSNYLYCLTCALVCVFVFAGCPASSPTIAGVFFVNVQTPATKAAQDGTTWATAFATIQQGISAADSAGGGEVWVAKGTYSEQRTGSVDGALELRSNVDVYGGFVGIEKKRSARDFTRNITIIDGSNGKGAGVPGDEVVLGADDAILDGFVITGSETTAHHRGGLYNTLVSPTIRNCTFFSNFAVSGGAILNDAASPLIENCRFENNFAVAGAGAIENFGSNPTITGCFFIGNSTADSSGAIGSLNHADVVVKDCVFLLNTAAQHSGAVGTVESAASFTNCVFAFNDATDDGGAMHNMLSEVQITNCVFYGNLAQNAGGAILDDGTDTQIVNTIFAGNVGSSNTDDITGTVAITFSCTQSTQAGTGNIIVDPKFVDPTNADFRLQAGSQCIDTGTGTGAPAQDIAGVNRPQGQGVDMGAFERAQVVF